ncbi:MAG: hypothetical protein JXA99_02035 [Candidatus Lokiarchaeota archaeon]|jgi:hypothetical protein|nr:hypothetical protein [Candidatus Lokiarchaeota archaeon]
MTPDKKATEIVNRINNVPFIKKENYKQYAITLVNERLREIEDNFLDLLTINKAISNKHRYWKDVREKINNMDGR